MAKIEQFINNYLIQENHWDAIIGKFYPSPDKIYKWHKHHRVLLYKNKIVKIQYLDKDSEVPPNQTIISEHSIYNYLDNKLYDYNAKLKKLYKGWYALEINFFEGEILQNLMEKNVRLKHLFFPLIFKALKLSFCGIYHPQLRSRHFLINNDNEICIIDFGNSEKTNFFNALIKNLGLNNYKKSKFLYVLKQILKFKYVYKNENFLSKNSFGKNFKFEDVKGNRNQVCFDINKLMRDKLSNNTFLYKKIPSFYIDKFHSKGVWDWEPVRKFLYSKINFNEKRIIVLDAGIGLLPIYFWKFKKNIISFEKNKILREIANNILSHFSSKYAVKKEPKDLNTFVKNSDTVIFFDLYSDRDFYEVCNIYRKSRKLFYICFNKKNQFIKKNNCDINLKIIYASDILIYEFLRL